jgi:ankyrin repeat protein
MRRTLTTGLSICAMVALSLSTLTHAAPAGTAAFVDAAMNGNRDAVRALLKDGADVNTTQADGMTALHWAAQKGDVELAKVLLYASANLKATTRIGGYTPPLIASKNGDAAMIETLTVAGADANTPTMNGTTPLMLARQRASSGRQGAHRSWRERERQGVGERRDGSDIRRSAGPRRRHSHPHRQRRRRQGDDQGGRPHGFRQGRAGAARR